MKNSKKSALVNFLMKKKIVKSKDDANKFFVVASIIFLSLSIGVSVNAMNFNTLNIESLPEESFILLTDSIDGTPRKVTKEELILLLQE